MSLAVVGVSHHTAPVEVRERFAFAPREAEDGLRLLREEGEIREAVLLSTCNRTEVYVYPAAEGAAAAVRRLLVRKASGGAGEPPEAYLYERRGDDAVRHLFRVAGGMDSMILGEAEIQGQVQEAYERSLELEVEPGLAGTVLSRLFERALAVGGRIRHETDLARGAASVASVAVDLARKVFGDLADRRVLILGAGTNAELVVEALSREGVRGVVVANRTYDRARELAGNLGGRAVRFEEMSESLKECDIVVASTAAPHPLLTVEGLRAAFPEGPRRPYLVIDIAIPRDVEPGVGDEPNVFLYNVDDLRQIVDENLERRREHLPLAEELVAREAADFRAWLASREVVPLIRNLRSRGHDLGRREMERALAGMEDLSPEDRARVEELTRRLVNKLLHEPTVRLKEGAANGRGEDLMEAVRFLYDLESRRDESGDDER